MTSVNLMKEKMLFRERLTREIKFSCLLPPCNDVVLYFTYYPIFQSPVTYCTFG